MNNIGENIIALYEAKKISKPTFEGARLFCKSCTMGTHKCCVMTREGFCCDLCLEDELLYLRMKEDIHTVASCCGHGNPELASIVTLGHGSRERMKRLGYEEIHTFEHGRDDAEWKPKSKLIYEREEG